MSKGGKRTGAGRPKGSTNKTSSEIRSLLSQAISGELEKIPDYLESITDAEKKLNLLAKFLPYIAAKIQPEAIPAPPQLKYGDLSKLSEAEKAELIDLALNDNLGYFSKEWQIRYNTLAEKARGIASNE